MNEEFNQKIKPMIERVIKVVEFENFLEEEIKILEDKIFHRSKSDINDEYFEAELLPRINKINRIISYIDNSENMESDNKEVFIQIKALQSMKNGSRFINNKNIFKRFIKRLEKMDLDISTYHNNISNIKNDVDDEKESRYWWEKMEENEDKSAKTWEETHKK